MIRALLIVAALAAPVAAQEAPTGDFVTGPEFDALTSGKTLTFTQNGALYGSEQYFDDRTVIWRYLGGACRAGRWYYDAPSLCFVYEDDPGPQCWLFERRGDRYFARVDDRPAGDPSEIELDTITETPLVCAGPDLGV